MSRDKTSLCCYFLFVQGGNLCKFSSLHFSNSIFKLIIKLHLILFHQGQSVLLSGCLSWLRCVGLWVCVILTVFQESILFQLHWSSLQLDTAFLFTTLPRKLSNSYTNIVILELSRDGA